MEEPWLAPLIGGDKDVTPPRPRAAAEPRQLAWIKAPPLGDDPNLHLCVAAYSSDFALLETTLLPHRKTIPSPEIQAASLDHSMWFHHAFRADEWLLYEMESPAAAGGRGLAIGRLYNRQGLLVCTVAQEGLIRRVACAGAGAGGGGSGSAGAGAGGGDRGVKVPPLRPSKL